MKPPVANHAQPTGPQAVYGHRLSAPRPTLWVPFLLACVLSAPVAVISLILALLP